MFLTLHVPCARARGAPSIPIAHGTGATGPCSRVRAGERQFRRSSAARTRARAALPDARGLIARWRGEAITLRLGHLASRAHFRRAETRVLRGAILRKSAGKQSRRDTCGKKREVRNARLRAAPPGTSLALIPQRARNHSAASGKT